MQLKELQKESKFTQQAIDNLKQKLITDYEDWYKDTFEEEAIQNTSSVHMSSIQS